jgi:hypothetical protein
MLPFLTLAPVALAHTGAEQFAPWPAPAIMQPGTFLASLAQAQPSSALHKAGGEKAANTSDTQPDPSDGPKQAEESYFEGSAWMDEAGTIHVRIASFDACVGAWLEGQLVYSVQHESYQQILEHVGPLIPGSPAVSIRPFSSMRCP